jgi:WD40 repeat protein
MVLGGLVFVCDLCGVIVTKIDTFGGHRDCVYALTPGTDPGTFYSAGGDGLVVRWQLGKPDQGELLAKLPASIYSVTLQPDTAQLWLGQNYDGVHLIDPVQKREINSLKLTSSAIFAIDFYKNDAFVALGDGVVAVVDTEHVAVRRHLKAATQAARCLAINPVERELAVGYSDNSVRIFSLTTLDLIRIIPAHTNSVFALTYSPDYRFLLTGSRDAHLKVWNVEKGYSLHQNIVAHLFTINRIAYSPNGQLVATGSMDKSIKLWDAETFRLLKVVDRARHAGHGTSVNTVCWLDDQTLVSGSDDRTISVWSVQKT